MHGKADITRLIRSPYWREADARVVVEAWQRSGESRSAFARRHGIDRRRLERWARRLEASRPVRFHPVRLLRDGKGVESGGEVGAIELQLTAGHRIRLPHGFEAEDLRRVLAVLGEVAAC